MLYIGSDKGGPEHRSTCIGKNITKVMNLVAEKRRLFIVGSSAALNVIFYVSGSVLRDVGCEGIRDGTFSRSQKLLMIQIAVPKELVDCEDEEVVRKFLFDSLREANKIAAKYFKKKGIEYAQPKFLGLVDAVEAKGGGRGQTYTFHGGDQGQSYTFHKSLSI